MKPNQISMQNNRNLRNAFTLVELMVAMALIILMLSIMSQAFVIATGTMQGLKEVADMQEKIRPAITLLQRDLGANHFEGSKKLSDPEFWDNGPPKEGYFMLWQDQAYEPASGVEPYGNESSFNGVSFSRSAAKANHMLAFTVKLPGKSPNEFFESRSFSPFFGNIFFNGAGTPLGMNDANIRRFESDINYIHSDWAEVAYFLGPHNAAGVVTADGNTDGKANPSVLSLPYYNLYRQQRLVLPSYNIAGVTLPPAGVNEEISCELATFSFNKPSDLTVPWKRMGNRTNVVNTQPPPMAPSVGLTSASYPKHYLGYPQTNMPLFSEFVTPSAKVNSDIIATNVISFDVKLLTDNQYDYQSLSTILGTAGEYNAHAPVGNYGSPNPRVFDTWSTDQGNAANTIPKYDLGYWNNITRKWQPSGNTLGNNSLIPVWNWNNNTGLNIKAVQISLRIWDQKSNTAKMFVVVQKL
jgi:type II secretory pathway pseudopilin PulG